MPDHAPAPAPCEIDVAVLSDTGTHLGRNHDCCGKYGTGAAQALVAVADGGAQAEGGELASQRAILALLRTYRESPMGTTLTQRMIRAGRNASFETYDLAVVVPQLRQTSTTLSAVAVAAGQMTAVHVGNGRVYLLRDGMLTQLSKDHTAAAEAEAEGRSHVGADGQRLTRSLGRELLVPIDVFEMDLKQGDVVLVCTDGLHTVLPEAVIARLAGWGDAAEACRQLVAEANRRATPDNLSVGLVRVVGPTR